MRVTGAVLLVCGLLVAAAHDKSVGPRIKHEVKADYTREARDAGIQGTVVLDTEVLADGTVGDIKISKSLDTKYGLDDQAMKAVKEWTFYPATVDGKPVTVRVDIEIEFRLN
jgi:periplasmic protein TonB